MLHSTAWWLLLGATMNAFAQYPATVRNAASFDQLIAPDSLAEVMLLPQSGSTSLPVLDPAATSVELGLTGIPVLGRGSSLASVLVYIPTGTPIGSTQLTLTSGNVSSLPVTVNIVESGFGLFSAVQNFRSDGPELNQLTRSAQPGDVITLWGTGLGNATDTTVLIGGIPVTPAYAGPAPFDVGVDQINVQIPDDARIPESCYVALQVQAGGRVSNLSRLSIARGSSVCSHPFGLSADALEKLDAGGTVDVGLLSLATFVGSVTPGVYSSFVRTDNAMATFFAYDASGLAMQAAPVFSQGAIAGCTASSGAFTAALRVANGLNVGPTVTLTGHAEWFDKSLSLPLDSVGLMYSSDLPASAAAADPNAVAASYFEAGPWTFAAPGSTTVLPFSSTFSIPPAIEITNLSALQTIDRARDAVVTWDPAGYTDDDILSLTLSATGSGLACQTLASKGQLTLPASLLQAVAAPASLQLSVNRAADHQPRFSVPLADGTTVPGVVSYTSSELVLVGFK